MHSYLVVAAKPGRSIPPHVLALLDAPCPAELAFVPDGHLRWTDDSGRLAYGGWQNLTHLDHLGSHWHVTEHGLTAFSGHLWPHGGMWAGDRSWAEQLGERWRSDPPVRGGQPYDGVFSMVRLARDGTGEIVTDPLAIAMLYRAESNDLVAFATRPGLAAGAVTAPGREPARDALAVGWLIYDGNLCGDRTGFSQVRALPIGSYAELHPRFGSRVRVADPTPWASPAGLPDDPRALLDLVHQDMLERVESIAKLPGRRPQIAELTGGRDTRLILSLIVEAGLQDTFRFRTKGQPETPDFVVGAELAALCGLDFEPVAQPAAPPRAASGDRPSAPSPERGSTFLRSLQIHTFQTSGMLNAVTLQGGVGIAPTTTVSGLIGEQLKTYYSAFQPIDTSEDLLDLYLRSKRVDVHGILRPEVREEYRRFVAEDLIERWDSESGLPSDRLDTFYIRNRLRRWGGTIEEIGNARQVYPLYSLVALQAAFALGGSRRRDEYLHFHIMRDACPVLAEHRFAFHGWRDSLLAEVPGADRYRAEPCTPAATEVRGSSTHGWLTDRVDHHREAIEAYLLDEPSSPLYEIVDRPAVAQALSGGIAPGLHPRYQMLGALTAAVWLGHHELPARVGTPSAELPSPGPLPRAPAGASGVRTDERAPRAVPSSTGADLARRLGRRAPAPIRRAAKQGLRSVRTAIRRTGG